MSMVRRAQPKMSRRTISSLLASFEAMTSPSRPARLPRMTLTLSPAAKDRAVTVTGVSELPSMNFSFSICQAGITASGLLNAPGAAEAARLVIKRFMYGSFTISLRSCSVQCTNIVEGMTTRSTFALRPFFHTLISVWMGT